MNLADAILILEKRVPNPNMGLPDEIFYYISKTTPLVNVDLLIKDENERTLLAWRDDQYAGKGWHLPGGIIRFKETFETRIKKVSELEVGTSVEYDLNPLAINQIILDNREYRGHFISILYKCFLTETFSPENNGLSKKDAGFVKWHDSCPKNLLKFHELYREYL